MSFRNSSTGEYPVSHDQVRRENPDVSFPAYFESAEGYDWVTPVVPPPMNPDTQYREEGAPIRANGGWQQTWVLKNFDAAQVVQRLTVKRNKLIDAFSVKTQQRLDTFARSRNYENILSACTYANSTVPKFKAEGQYCVGARDATWAKLYEIFAEVDAGTRPAPAKFEDVEKELPVLAWP